MKKVVRFILITLLLLNFSSVHAQSTSLPIYRSCNPYTGEHLYSSSAWEDFVLTYSRGWISEGVCWYYKEYEGDKVYRFYNPEIDDHLYTADPDEINRLLNSGWLIDNNGYALFFSSGDVPIYRLFHPISGRHLLTRDLNEFNTLPQYGWKQEGIAMYGYSS